MPKIFTEDLYLIETIIERNQFSYNYIEIKMNQKSVNSLVEIIESLSEEERHMIQKKLFLDTNQVTTQEMIDLAQKSNSFDFLNDEPDLYTLEDGEAI